MPKDLTTRAFLFACFVLIAVLLLVFMSQEEPGSDTLDPGIESNREQARTEPRRVPAAITERPARSESVPVETSLADATVDRDLEDAPGLENLKHLRIRVLNEDLEPVQAAQVQIHRIGTQDNEVWNLDIGGRPVETGETDTEGSYTTRNVGIIFAVSARKKGLGGSSVVFTRSQESEVGLVLERPSLLRGLVLDQRGRPLESAQVRGRAVGITVAAGRFRRETEPEIVLSDKNGRFEMPFAPGGVIALTATHGGSRSNEVEVDSPERGDVAEIVLQMPGRYRVEGLIRDEEGNVAEYAVVRVWGSELKGYPTSEANWQGSRRTDESGRYEIDLPTAGRYQIVASRSDGERSKPAEFELSEAEPGHQIDLQFAPLSFILVRVLDANRGPVPRAYLKAEQPVPNRYGVDAPGPGDLWGASHGFSRDDGLVKLDGLVAGENYQLRLRCENPTLIVERGPVLAAGQEFNFVLTDAEIPKRSIKGVLISDLDESAVQGCKIDLYYISSIGQSQIASCRTAADGSFYFDQLQEEGQHRIQTQPERALTTGMVIEALEQDMEVVLRQPTPLALKIEVVDEGDRPLSYHLVRLKASNRSSYVFSLSQRLDQFGRGEFPRVGSGKYDVQVSGRRDYSTSIKIDPHHEGLLRIVVR